MPFQVPQNLIMLALEKDLERRYKSVDEFLLELSRNPLLQSGRFPAPPSASRR